MLRTNRRRDLIPSRSPSSSEQKWTKSWATMRMWKMVQMVLVMKDRDSTSFVESQAYAMTTVLQGVLGSWFGYIRLLD